MADEPAKKTKTLIQYVLTKIDFSVYAAGIGSPAY